MPNEHFDFSSPFAELVGIKIIDWQDGSVRLEAEMKEAFSNLSGTPHGGFIATLLDVGTSLPGIYCPFPGRVRNALTLSLNTNFVNVATDNTFIVTGKRVRGGHKIYHSYAELHDGKGVLLATAQAVLKLSKGSESPEGLPVD